MSRRDRDRVEETPEGFWQEAGNFEPAIVDAIHCSSHCFSSRATVPGLCLHSGNTGDEGTGLTRTRRFSRDVEIAGETDVEIRRVEGRVWDDAGVAEGGWFGVFDDRLFAVIN